MFRALALAGIPLHSERLVGVEFSPGRAALQKRDIPARRVSAL